MQHGGEHHLHLRKRTHKGLEPFPHPEFFKRLLDRLMVFIAIAGPAAMLPQVYEVFASKDASSLSLTTWFLWLLISGVWLIYGLVHKDLPIIVSQGIYIILNTAIVGAIFIYA